MSYFFYISTSYLVSALVLSLLTAYIVLNYYKNKKLLEKIEDNDKQTKNQQKLN